MIILKTLQQIDGIRKSCKIVAYVLSKLKEEVKIGITTKYLNALAEELCYERGGTPGFKGYRGFPFSICASVNSEVVHGFPNSKKLKSGDIINIDITLEQGGFIADSSKMYMIGELCIFIHIHGI